MSLTSAGRSAENLDVLDEKRKSDIKNVLDDQFCDLGSETQENTCSVQNLEFRVRREFVVEFYKSFPKVNLNMV